MSTALEGPDTMGERLSGRSVGTGAAWARDLAIVGGVSSFAAPVWFVGNLGWGYVWAAALFGALGGAALGAVMPWLLTKPLRRFRIAALLALGPLLGFAWGALTGLLAAPLLAFSHAGPLVSALVARIAGIIQFGWFWLPYAMSHIRGRGTRRLVLAACLVGPMLGPASVFTLLSLT